MLKPFQFLCDDFVAHSLVDAPPEVVFGLAPPREYGDPGLCQRGGHLVLGREDVAGRPSEIEHTSPMTEE